MRRFLLATALISLLLVSPALADDQSSEQVTKLEDLRLYYEALLRDAKTETAAKYFVERLDKLDARRTAPLPLRPTAAAGVSARMDAWLRGRVARKVQEKGIGLSDVTAWTRRELPEAFWTELGRGVGARAIPPRAYAESVWANRGKGAWLSASYGSGTYIVTPASPRPPRKDAYDRLPEAVKAKLKLRLPKPPTRDQWWERAGKKERTAWTMAYFVENSGLFEVAEEPLFTTCRSCTGEGYQGSKLESGLSFSYLCHRCAGAQRDKTVRFR